MYFVLAIMSGTIGVINGYYLYNLEMPWLVTKPPIRPLLEYIIYLYYFIYFVVFMNIFIKTDQDKQYFYKVFFFMFFLSVFLGIIDYILIDFFEIDFISRQIYDLSPTPHRFHGLFGEPRDAFVVLGVGLGLYYSRNIFQGRKNNYWVISVIVACMLLTKSTSALISVSIFVLLYALITFLYKSSVKSIAVLIVGVILVFSAEALSPRIQKHSQYLTQDSLESLYFGDYADVPDVLSGQMSNIYPVFWIIERTLEGDVIPLLVGGGLGVSNAINSKRINDATDVLNPQANITRVFSATGLFGVIILLMAFIYPVKRCIYIDKQARWSMLVFTIFVVSLFFGHRSSAPFIYIGVILSVFNGSSSFISSEKSKL